MGDRGAELCAAGGRVSPEVRFLGVYPLCFTKSAQGFKNEWVAGGWKTRVWKWLKRLWLLECVEAFFTLMFECARALGRFRLGWENVAAWVRRDSIVRSLSVGGNERGLRGGC